ncbi:MAG: hypothetical protein ACRDCB_05820 [Clostridium sp.]|uniref:hypothetical protein n=1 Tax=Clostridium TaxID=1485 RepID=UPI0021520CAA|nr:hypothetical protein [Clostridium sp. LY3-2]MCR6515914.1 hypothetical protein [Clostridium sp. LY3-2]
MKNSKKLSKNKKFYIVIALLIVFIINLIMQDDSIHFVLRIMKSAISMWIGVVAIFLVAKIISLINLSRES